MTVVLLDHDVQTNRSRTWNGRSPCQVCAVRHLTFCAAIEPRSLNHLRAFSEQISFAPRETIFTECDRARYIYNVTEGAARIYKLLPDGRRQIIGFLFPGDFMGLSAHDTYAYGAEAITRMSLCRYSRVDPVNLLTEFPELNARLFKLVVSELTVAQDQMLLLGRKSALERVASFLLMLSDRAVMRGQPGDVFALPMTREDIADYLGLCIETVSRSLSKFKRAGLIALEPDGNVTLLNREALRHIDD